MYLSSISLVLLLLFLLLPPCIEGGCEGDGGLVFTINDNNADIYGVVSLENGDIVTASSDGKVKVYDHEKGEFLRELLPSHSPAGWSYWIGIAILPFNNHIVTVAPDKKIIISDPRSGNLTRIISGEIPFSSPFLSPS